MTTTERTQQRVDTTTTGGADFNVWEKELGPTLVGNELARTCEHMTWVTCATCGKTYEERLRDGTSVLLRYRLREDGDGYEPVL